MKICIRCKRELDLDFFGFRDKTEKDRYNTCKSCKKEQQVIYYQKNKEKIKEKYNKLERSEYNKNYRVKNKEKLAEYGENYRNINKEKIVEYSKEYYEKNRERRLSYAIRFRSENREKLLKYDKERYAREKANGKNKYMKNREEIILKNKERRKNDPKTHEKDEKYREKYRYIIIWRSLLRNYLVRVNKGKEDKTINLLGYTDIQLKSHIEKQFINKMTWDNYGENWQIDHIIQVFLFKENTPASIVNSLENLRPLDKFKNLSRGKEIDNLELLEKFKDYLKHN